MIQIYIAGNEDFTQNGDMVLTPEECIITAEINGAWSLELTHPIDNEARFKYIKAGAVLSVPSFVSEENQLFRIYSTNKTDTSITAYARPIFLDSQEEVFLFDTRPTICSGQAALDILMNGTKYSGQSNITAANTAYYIRKNLIECLASSDENSFLNRWGGEIIYNNFKVIINEKCGSDRGVQALFGRNITGIQENISFDNVITRIIPVAYNGRMLTTSKKYVDSSRIDNYTHVYAKEVKYEDIKYKEDTTDGTGYDTLIEVSNALRAAAQADFAAGCDLPTCSYNINMVDLSRTEQYKDYVQFERISLGDTIDCQYSPLDISTKARVVKLQYDCINEKNDSVTLGDFTYDYFSDITKKNSNLALTVGSVINSDGTLMAEKIHGILNTMNTQLRLQKTAAEKQEVRAILFEDTDRTSELYGAMCLGTQGFQIANTRTEDDSDWDWSTAFTANGGYADVLVSGLLSDKLGRNYWNLDTGKLVIRDGQIKINTNSETDDEINLHCDEFELNLSPLQVEVKNTNEGFSVLIQGGGIFVYDKNGNAVTWVNENGFSTSKNASIDGELRYGVIKSPVGNSGVTGSIVDESGKRLAEVEGGIITHIW